MRWERLAVQAEKLAAALVTSLTSLMVMVRRTARRSAGGFEIWLISSLRPRPRSVMLKLAMSLRSCGTSSTTGLNAAADQPAKP